MIPFPQAPTRVQVLYVSVIIVALVTGLESSWSWRAVELSWSREGLDPSFGRYRQADPHGIAPSPNRYGYAEASPLGGIDPTGEWMAWIHKTETINGAVHAGMTLIQAARLADLVVKADSGTQEAMHAHQHAMCAKYRGRPVDLLACQDKYEKFVADQMARCDLEGLANAIHARQDSLSPGHENMTTYSAWGDVSLGHIIADMAANRLQQQQLRDITRHLIEKWRASCSCRRLP